ncbi:hypothetical protein C8F04DRAFT_1356622 [Mycena alexandri]|uniref:Uncharacterized protein n=1 Tax=Mycena alexandri TaxID=1745969 RepID=A0AAD6THC5_9AGAR|nr:hypothetical protein C8F04DRAFT_1356622 [Mycena alexandri]
MIPSTVGSIAEFKRNTIPLLRVLAVLDDLNGTLKTPFVASICAAARALIPMVENTRKNQEDCFVFIRDVHHVLYGFLDHLTNSDTTGPLPPTTLSELGVLNETLRKIYTFVEVQDEHQTNYAFTPEEAETLLKDCGSGLVRALEVFKIDDGPPTDQGMNSLQKRVLQIIKSSSGTGSDKPVVNDLPPPTPEILYGRESELQQIVTALAQDSPKVVILGGPAMGKTTLAKVALTHPDICAKFERRIFVDAQSAASSVELAVLIGLRVGLRPGGDLTKAVVDHFSRGPPTLLVVDGLDISSAWEQVGSGTLEEYLSLLTGVDHLALVVTMGGLGQPAMLGWSEISLGLLSDDASRQLFVAIAGDSHNPEEVQQILELAGKNPLAVDLLAHLVQREGLSDVLTRLNAERPSILPDNQVSNLDACITLSVSSPRITPSAKDLLSLLSAFPDGLSQVELMQSNVPIEDILGCGDILQATSLVHETVNKRLKCSGAIRNHLQKFNPPPQSLVRSLRNYFKALLDLHQRYDGEDMVAVVNQITPNLGNLHHVFGRALDTDPEDLPTTIRGILALNSLMRMMERGNSSLMERVPAILSQLGDPRLEMDFIVEVLELELPPSMDMEALVNRGNSIVQDLSDLRLEARFYRTAAGHYFRFKRDIRNAMTFTEKALAAARSCGEAAEQAGALINLAHIKLVMGDFTGTLSLTTEIPRFTRLSADFGDEVMTLRLAAIAWSELGNYPRALSRIERAKTLAGMCGAASKRLTFKVMGDEGEIRFLKSEYAESHRIRTQIVQNTSAEDDPERYAQTVANIAAVGVRIGMPEEEIRRNLDEAKPIFNTLQITPALIYCEMVSADLELRKGNTARVKKILQEHPKSPGSDPGSIGFCFEQLADAARWPATEWETTAPVVYLAQTLKMKDKLGLYKALLFLADIFIPAEEATARNLLRTTLIWFAGMDMPHYNGKCMLRLGDLAEFRGNRTEAEECWKRARPLFERSLQAAEVAEIDGKLRGSKSAQA